MATVQLGFSYFFDMLVVFLGEMCCFTKIICIFARWLLSPTSTGPV